MNQEQNNLLKQNIHVMTNEKLKELGCNFDEFWNNRAFYSLSKESKFAIYEHGGWGIMDPFATEFKLIYCDLTDEEIEKYTKLVKSYEDIVRHPKDNSLYNYATSVEKLNDFINEMKKRG